MVCFLGFVNYFINKCTVVLHLDLHVEGFNSLKDGKSLCGMYGSAEINIQGESL